MARISAVLLCATVLAFAVLSATAQDATPDSRKSHARIPKQWTKTGVHVRGANGKTGKLYLAKLDYNHADPRCNQTVQATCFTSHWIVVRGKRADTVAVPVKDLKASSTTGRKLSAAGGCDILNLMVGPLNLNVLGLEVNLDNLNLDVTGQTGQGQLLGNLLCQIAGLLDGGVTGLLDTLLGTVTNLLGNLLGSVLGSLLGPLLGTLLGGLGGGLLG